ncbi:hypothetical protein [Fictibacillus phosphorivorans]|uniref:hypothetical protein n=1 Tax=Fictibacillus phosphorivorans TaxID=1221500 RepID=UPI0035EFF429
MKMIVRINGEVIGKSEINSKVRTPNKILDSKSRKILSIVAPTITSLLHFSPEMTIAYTIVCGVGVSLIGIGLIENMFITSGNTRTAEIIERITKSVLLISTTIGIGYFIFHAPMWHWGK